jgi:hypothetical protein
VYSDGTTSTVTGTAAWDSGMPAIATVSTGGQVTGVGFGDAVISASLNGLVGLSAITVNRPALASLAVTPATASIERFATQPFSALATYVDTSTETVTTLVAWSSSDESVATISDAGVARGGDAGTVVITAQWGTTSGTASLTVKPPVLLSIAVSGPSAVATGSAAQLVATGTWSDGTTGAVTAQAQWASDAGLSALVGNVDGVRGLVQGLDAGAEAITATVDTISSAPFAMRVLDTNAPYAGRCGPGLVISQVYGGGGNTGATWQNDFVELHNPTTSGLSVGGLSLQYTSNTGTSWGSNLLALPNVTVPPGGYFLVKLAGGAVGTALPAADATGTINMSASNGKIALVKGTAALASVACPTTNVLDLVGFGTADCGEGGTKAPAPSASTSIVRGVSGCRDGNSNSADFTILNPPAPRNLASTPPLLCSCSVNGTALAEELNTCQLQSPATLTPAAGDVSPIVSALVTQPGLTDTAGFSSLLQVQVGFGASGVNPTSAGGWSWWPAPGTTSGTVSDAYGGVFLSPTSGSYGFTARASKDGVNWTACDLNGAGSATGLAFEMGQLGVLTVP